MLTSLSGSTTTYRPDGLVATVTKAGATTTFAYWPDGTRRRATTVDPQTGTTTVTLHYDAQGTLVNDTTTQPSGSATASYLLTSGREARTLSPAMLTAGKVATPTAAAPVTTGSGVGYYLRDRHASVTALVDSSGAVTNTYAYTDYGAPGLLDGRPGTLIGSAPGTGAGQANPLKYDGSSLTALYTDPALGTLMARARTYDPAQGRFTAPDTANVHNRYTAFDTNPVMKSDPSGQTPIADFVIDSLYVVTFVVAVYFTGGAALAAGSALWGAFTAGETTAATVGLFVADSVAAGANATGLAANAARLADDIKTKTSGKGYFSQETRDDLSNIATVAGTVAGVASMGAAAAQASIDEAQAAAKVAAAANPQGGGGPPDTVAGNAGGGPGNGVGANGAGGDGAPGDGVRIPNVGGDQNNVGPLEQNGPNNNGLPNTNVLLPPGDGLPNTNVVLPNNGEPVVPGIPAPQPPVEGAPPNVPPANGGGANQVQVQNQGAPPSVLVANNVQGLVDNVVNKDPGVQEAMRQVKEYMNRSAFLEPDAASGNQTNTRNRSAFNRFDPQLLRTDND